MPVKVFLNGSPLRFLPSTLNSTLFPFTAPVTFGLPDPLV